MGLPNSASKELISQKIEEFCVKAMNNLVNAGLITMDETGCIESTEAGRLMSVYYLDLETMKLIMKLEGTESLERLLWLVCESHELSDMHLRVDERRCLNTLNRNNTATIRFPMKGKINSRQMKLNCIIQAVLGCMSIPDPSLNQEAMKIMRIADRVCKCLLSYVTRPSHISQNPKFFKAMLNSILLAKCIYAHIWENTPYVSRQLKGIGPAFSSLLASAGKVNFMLLEESHPRDLERIMNKGPPAGNILRKQVSLLPKYNLTMTPINERTVQIKMSLLNHAYLAENIEQLTAGANHKSYIIVGDSENVILYFTHFKETDLINVYDGCITFEITRKDMNEHNIFVHCISATFVGIDEQCQYLFKEISPITLRVDPQQGFASALPKSPSEPIHVVKEIKRKSQNDNEIVQSKEKKKRDGNIVAKFKLLKESFGKASKEIKINIDKTAEMSKNIMKNLKQSDQNHNRSWDEIDTTKFISDEDLQKVFKEDFEYKEFVDDEQVKNILSGIENEIKVSEEILTEKSTSSCISSNCKITKFENNNNSDKLKIDNAFCKNQYGGGKRKILHTRNNYNFRDKLEKKQNECDESDICKIAETGTGFSSAVKTQICQYLQHVTNKNTIKKDFINLMEPIAERNTQNSINFNNENDDLVMKIAAKNYLETTNYNNVQIKSEKHNSDEVKANFNDLLLIHEGNLNEIGQKSDVTAESRDIDTKFLVPVENNTYSNDDSYKVLHENEKPRICNKITKTRNNIEDNAINNRSLIIPLPNVNLLESTNSNELGNIVGKHTIPNQKKCLRSATFDDTFAYNHSIEEESKSSENLKHIKRYSLHKTNIVDLTTKNNSNKKVKILGKLQINLDVIEIAYNTNDNISSSSSSNNNNVSESNRSKSLITDINSLKKYEIKGEHRIPKKVKDILQKYNNIRLDKYDIENKCADEPLNANNKPKNLKTTDIKQNIRKYRISDLPKVQVDLPLSLTGSSQTTSLKILENDLSQKTVNNTIDAYSDKVNNEGNPELNIYIENNISELESEINELKTRILSPELSIPQINSDLDVNETILNPKTLLQGIKKDEDIIPPPTEFCDDTFTYSPTSPYNIINIDFNNDDESDPIDIFNEPQDNLALNENLWTLLTGNDPQELIDSNTNDDFTAMHNNVIDSNMSDYLNLRRTKLSQFKLNRKNMFRK